MFLAICSLSACSAPAVEANLTSTPPGTSEAPTTQPADNLPEANNTTLTTPTETTLPTPTVTSPAPAATVAVEQFSEALPTPPALTGNLSQDNSGDLLVLFSTAGNATPKSASTVYVFSSKGLIDQGESEGGVFRAVLPQDTYDLVILHQSLPPGGYLQKNVIVSAGETTTLALPAALEANLDVTLHSLSGNPPKNPYVVVISVDGQEVTRQNVRIGGTEVSNILLRTGLVYEITIQYGDVEVTKEEVAVQTEDSVVELRLPYDEGQLEVFLSRKGEALLTPANLVVVDPHGREVIPRTEVADQFSVYLPAGLEYSVQVQYIDQVEEQSVLIEPAGFHPISFDFHSQ